MVDKLNQQVTGSDTYLEEVKSALNKDDKRLGEVWRLSKEGLKPKQIAEKLGVDSSSFVYGYQFYTKVIVEGVLPEPRTTAEGCARALRGFAKRHRDSFSHATDSELQKRAKKCDRIADAAKREGQTDEPSAKKDESADWRDALLDTLQNMPPDAFERLCQKLLRKSVSIEVKATGKSGDGGIDGWVVIHLLAGMISFRVPYQCKRYSGNVGPDKVRDFRGAMAGRAERGVILTTSDFTTGAQGEATRDDKSRICLIDGQLLMDKMKELELGVRTKTVDVVQVEVDKLLEKVDVMPSPADTSEDEVERPPKTKDFKFTMANVPIDAILKWAGDPNITCKVVDQNNLVEYKGTRSTISGLAKKIKGWSAARGPLYWVYEGETLQKRRERFEHEAAGDDS